MIYTLYAKCINDINLLKLNDEFSSNLGNSVTARSFINKHYCAYFSFVSKLTLEQIKSIILTVEDGHVIVMHDTIKIKDDNDEWNDEHIW